MRALARMTAIVAVLGVASGLVGGLLVILLHAVQHVAFGYSEGLFLYGSEQARAWRRLLCLMAAGLIAGVGWWAVYRWFKPLVSIGAALGREDTEGKRMPFWPTVVHGLLQIVTVALGSPLGREVAPREISAAVADRITDWVGVLGHPRRVLIASSAGAGLAAVYGVPLGGAVFTLEVLLVSFALSAVIPALACSAIAAGVAAVIVPDDLQYTVGHTPVTTSVWFWAVVFGPLCGLAAWGFRWLTLRCAQAAPRDWQLIPRAFAAFTTVGLISMVLPQILGNGKAAAQVGFDHSVGFWTLLALLAARVVAVALALLGGGQGGLLTPSIANGSLLGALVGTLWSGLNPGTVITTYALIGAAAFLAAAQRMPATAILLVFELTRMDAALLGPTMVAAAGSAAIERAIDNRRSVAS
ncbi:chloride channel protein [Branchiibius sp. NY16-3462-2]|uniref:chloride channel protein n=1 Tax=Branchiibius sp. NY16-3462-2 TaxID=1807500 RepID=UPI0025C275C9|nr:chloride channel protein [Branchiibius sp. NY16-3462-2]